MKISVCKVARTFRLAPVTKFLVPAVTQRRSASSSIDKDPSDISPAGSYRARKKENLDLQQRLNLDSEQRQQELRWESFSVDRSDLPGTREISYEDPDADSSNLSHKESLSPLAQELLSYLKLRGPITVHEFMSQAANHVLHGYYQNRSEKIGGKGDFVTSPEISQLFGEMLAVWCVSSWEAMGSPPKVKLVELGPGRGTLLKDILRSTTRFPKFQQALSLHLVELSERMREKQREALDCVGEVKTDKKQGTASMITRNGTPVTWYMFLSQLTRSEVEPFLIIGQEFLDAFPVHQFVFTEKGWREKLVDRDTSSTSTLHFRNVLAPNVTPAVKTLISRQLPGESQNNITPPAVGDGIEVCPLALATCEDIGRLVSGKGRGAALLIDYGEDYTQADSLRGFKKHQQVHVLSEPGLVDVTTDVDFRHCAQVAARKGAKVSTLLTQSNFLVGMGIVDRVEKLIELESTTEKEAEELLCSLKRLVGHESENLGVRFKVLSIVHKDIPFVGFPQVAPK